MNLCPLLPALQIGVPSGLDNSYKIPSSKSPHTNNRLVMGIRLLLKARPFQLRAGHE